MTHRHDPITTLIRCEFPARIADLAFSMDVPDGFAEPEYPREDPDFSDPTVSAPLALLVSPVALALIAIAARPAYEHGSVDDWARFLASHFEITIEGNITGFVGGPTHRHPAVLIEGTKEENGTRFVVRIVAIEDGGRLVTAHCLCPEELWPSFSAALELALLSIELANPKGPTVPCVPGGPIPIVYESDTPTGDWPMGRGKHRELASDRKARRDAAAEQARPLIAAGRFDEAELLVRQADSDIQGGIAIARLYEARLREMVGAGVRPGDKVATETVFRRALAWAQNNYPEPHTQDEADSYAQGRADDLSRLTGILGYEPAAE